VSNTWTFSSALLALAGMIVAVIALYFIVLRPSLLPEDIRYMGLSAAELEAIGPRLATWLSHVFRVLGGYALATGVLLIAVASTAFRTGHCSNGGYLEHHSRSSPQQKEPNP